jgi:mono/diheme cytochrome c family protein
MRLSSISMALDRRYPTMKAAFTFGTALFVTLLGLSCAAPEAPAPTGEREVKAWLPAGDPAAGREAFTMLQCHACHQVKGDRDLPELTAVDLGPELGPELSRFSQGDLVSAIVVPSHSMVHFGAKAGDAELSRMGDFTEVMTVRQLVDVVAYLEQIARP